MFPFNVVMAATLTGKIDPEKVQAAIHLQRSRHSLMAVRLIIEGNDISYTTQEVPENPLIILPRESGEQWEKTAEEQLRDNFKNNIARAFKRKIIQVKNINKYFKQPF